MFWPINRIVISLVVGRAGMSRAGFGLFLASVSLSA